MLLYFFPNISKNFSKNEIAICKEIIAVFSRVIDKTIKPLFNLFV